MDSNEEQVLMEEMSERNLEEHKNVTDSLRQEIQQLKQALAEQSEKYEAFTGIRTKKEDHDNDSEHVANSLNMDTGDCILKKADVCDSKQLLLLPCLHSVCKPCADKHDHKIITCKCGREINLETEDLPFDFVSWNESLLAKGKRHCGYLREQCTNEVVSYCTNCNVSMCSNCQDVHGKIRMMASHELVPIDNVDQCPPEKRLRPSTCTKHAKQPMLYLDKDCHQAICHICLTEEQAGHEVKGLKTEYDSQKADLMTLLMNYEECLREIQKNLNGRLNRLSELKQSHDKLEEQIAEVHEKLALKILYRLHDLTQKMNQECSRLQDTVREDILDIRGREGACLTTIAYANRCIKSTTQAEFLELSDVITRKISEDLDKSLPEDNTQGKHVVFSCQGQKALENLTEVFGDVSCSDTPEPKKDGIPTLSEIQEECRLLLHDKMDLTDQVTAKEVKLETKEQMTADLKRKLQVAEERVNHLQASLSNIGIEASQIVTPYLLMTTAVKTSLILHCVYPEFDHKRVNQLKTRINDDGHLVNTPETRPDIHTETGFKNYCGTTSTVPLHKAGGPQYLEIFTSIKTDKLLLKNVLLLNIGLCREADRDVAHYIPAYEHCYSLEVGMCSKHDTVCTRIWKSGKTVYHQTDTVLNSEDSETYFHFGIVLDSVREKIVFLDAKYVSVMTVLENVNFSNPLWPMFGLYKLDGVRVEMKVATEKNLEIGVEKKALILKALCKWRDNAVILVE